MSSDTEGLKLLESQSSLDNSVIHKLTTEEIKLCIFMVNGGMDKDSAALRLKISKYSLDKILKKDSVKAYINLLKERLTDNAVQATNRQLLAIRDKAFETVMERFEEPDHTRDLPPNATPEQIKLYYQGFARYTPLKDIHKIYESVNKQIIETVPEDNKTSEDESTLQARVSARFEQRRVKQRRLMEAMQSHGIDAKEINKFMDDENIIDIGDKPTVKQNEDDVIEETTTITLEGSVEDISKLSMFNKTDKENKP